MADQLAIVCASFQVQRQHDLEAEKERLKADLYEWWKTEGNRKEVFNFAKEGRVNCVLTYKAGERGMKCLNTNKTYMYDHMPAECKPLIRRKNMTPHNPLARENEFVYVIEFDWADNLESLRDAMTQQRDKVVEKRQKVTAATAIVNMNHDNTVESQDQERSDGKKTFVFP